MKIKNRRGKTGKKTRVITTTVTSPFVRQQSQDGRYVEIIVTTSTGKIRYRVPKEPLEISTEVLIPDVTEAMTG